MLSCLLEFFIWERNKINWIRFPFFLGFCWVKPFICNHLRIHVLQETQSHLYSEEWLVLKMMFEFVSFSLSFVTSSGLITLLLCIWLLQPWEGPTSLLFIVTATPFCIIFLRLTCPKVHVMWLHNLQRLAGGLIRITSDLKCSSRRISSCVKFNELGCHSVASPSPITWFPYPWTKWKPAVC